MKSENTPLPRRLMSALDRRTRILLGVGVGVVVLMVAAFGGVRLLTGAAVDNAVAKFQPRYDSLRDKLTEVPGLLSKSELDVNSCAKTRPKFHYVAADAGSDTKPEGNAEILMESQTEHPDALIDYREHFGFGGSTLLEGLRLTGPKGYAGTGQFALPSNAHPNGLAARLKNGADTRYLVVLRETAYTPPETGIDGDGGVSISAGFSGSVELDGYVVDLKAMTVDCRVTVDTPTPGGSLKYAKGQNPDEVLFERIQEDTGDTLARELERVTDGAAATPPTRGSTCGDTDGDVVAAMCL